MSAGFQPAEAESPFDALIRLGWQSLSGDQQDALIAQGWHPGKPFRGEEALAEARGIMLEAERWNFEGGGAKVKNQAWFAALVSWLDDYSDRPHPPAPGYANIQKGKP